MTPSPEVNPFTKRMIARAKVRRKEINEKMSSFSQNPLEDISNNTTSSVKDDKPNVKSPVKSPVRSPAPKVIKKQEDDCLNKQPTRTLRSNKLAALASAINTWEDDLSHPQLKPLESPKPPVVTEKENKKAPWKSIKVVERQSPSNREVKKPIVSEKPKQTEVGGKAKDPAEMSLSERRALFESKKNKSPVQKVSISTRSASKIPSQRSVSKLPSPRTTSTTKLPSPKQSTEVKVPSLKRRSTRTSPSAKPQSATNTPSPKKQVSKKKAPSPPKQRKSVSPKKEPEVAATATETQYLTPPPKPARLYPDLTALIYSDAYQENLLKLKNQNSCEVVEEQSVRKENFNATFDLDVNNSSDDDSLNNTSFGRSILQAVAEKSLMQEMEEKKDEPDSEIEDSEESVLQEMDDFLDECIEAQESDGPTPAKQNKEKASPSAASLSFKYTQGSPYCLPVKKRQSLTPEKEVDETEVSGSSEKSMMRSVNSYRRLQTLSTPIRVITRKPETTPESESSQMSKEREKTLVQEKLKRLQEEVSKQQTIIGQASQALNLCNSTIEFSGSREQVEGERLLLVATHRRQAALAEIQRLKNEGTLLPKSSEPVDLRENGSLTISEIKLPMKKHFVRNMDPNICLHFVCLVRHLDVVAASPVFSSDVDNVHVTFPEPIKLMDLYSNFKLTVEVYTLQTLAEVLPHEIKYHIQSESGHLAKRICKTPKKFLKHDSRLQMPKFQSPAGPNAVRSPAFAFSGSTCFTLNDVHRREFTLKNVPSTSPLEDSFTMKISCELSVSVEHHNFLTMFEDVSGFGAWHRRWCLLKGTKLSYWKYPDDEHKKLPIGTLDLKGVTTKNVGLVSRDICARPNTFLLEVTRASSSSDTDSLICVKDGGKTIVRHLLSADTKEDRLEWCQKLNKTLNLMRAWGAVNC